MRTIALVAISTILAFGAPALAQQKVKVGPGGVEVDTGAVKVKADESGVEVHADDVDVEAGKSGASVRIGVKKGSRHSPPAKAAPSAGKVGNPIVCDGNQEKTYTGVLIKGYDTAVLAKGNCDLTLKNCTIEAERYGVMSKSNGDVKLINCRIKGRKAAVSVKGNGDVSARNCILSGGVETFGNGEFEDEGNNSIGSYD
ncbi:MAG: right-handed parallel beta-helix repeat-containing protein [Deltaproteobacteria bacterium]|nr:MAG: right-handed parallel beta-helix repeat-containing protein [Deltaproteobacteria bacterium]